MKFILLIANVEGKVVCGQGLSALLLEAIPFRGGLIAQRKTKFIQ